MKNKLYELWSITPRYIGYEGEDDKGYISYTIIDTSKIDDFMDKQADNYEDEYTFIARFNTYDLDKLNEKINYLLQQNKIECAEEKI